MASKKIPKQTPVQLPAGYKPKHTYFTGTVPDSGTMPHSPVKQIGLSADGQAVYENTAPGAIS